MDRKLSIEKMRSSNIEITYLMLLIIIENYWEMFNLVLACGLLKRCWESSIDSNVKSCHKDGKGWTDVISIYVTEKTHYSLFSDFWPQMIDSCLTQIYHMKTMYWQVTMWQFDLQFYNFL